MDCPCPPAVSYTSPSMRSSAMSASIARSGETLRLRLRYLPRDPALPLRLLDLDRDGERERYRSRSSSLSSDIADPLRRLPRRKSGDESRDPREPAETRRRFAEGDISTSEPSPFSCPFFPSLGSSSCPILALTSCELETTHQETLSWWQALRLLQYRPLRQPRQDNIAHPFFREQLVNELVKVCQTIAT